MMQVKLWWNNFYFNHFTKSQYLKVQEETCTKTTFCHVCWTCLDVLTEYKDSFFSNKAFWKFMSSQSGLFVGVFLKMFMSHCSPCWEVYVWHVHRSRVLFSPLSVCWELFARHVNLHSEGNIFQVYWGCWKLYGCFNWCWVDPLCSADCLTWNMYGAEVKWPISGHLKRTTNETDSIYLHLIVQKNW